MAAITYEVRQAAARISAEVAREVAHLGQAEGLWSTVDDSGAGNHDAARYFARLITPQGHTFTLSGGTWGHEDKVKAGLGEARLGPHHKAASGPEARVSSERGAETVLKELKRRVFCHPEAIVGAQAALEGVRRLAQGAATLAEVKAQATALGVTFRDGALTDTHSAKGYIPKLNASMFLTVDGTVQLDHVVLPLAKLEALLALLAA